MDGGSSLVCDIPLLKDEDGEEGEQGGQGQQQ
jgi:hypothetical protein